MLLEQFSLEPRVGGGSFGRQCGCAVPIVRRTEYQQCGLGGAIGEQFGDVAQGGPQLRPATGPQPVLDQTVIGGGGTISSPRAANALASVTLAIPTMKVASTVSASEVARSRRCTRSTLGTPAGSSADVDPRGMRTSARA